MNTKIYKYIIAFVLAFMALPMMAQDYMEIHFKDGTTRKFHLKNVMEITTSRQDANGILHSDYDFQHVTTISNKYVYALSDVDSVVFTKYNEEKVEECFKSATKTIFSSLRNCETIEDAEKVIDKIESSNDVEKVWREDESLYIKISNWGVMSFDFGIEEKAPTEKFHSNARQIDGIKKALSQKTDDGGVKKIRAVIANQTELDEEDETKSTKEEFDELENLLKKNNIEVKPISMPGIDFFASELFDYDIVIICNHGGCTDGKHFFLTGDELGLVNRDFFDNPPSEETKDEWLIELNKVFNNSKVSQSDVTNEDIYFKWVKEKRKGQKCWVGYPQLFETFYDKIEKVKFKNKQSIMFLATCRTLKNGNSFAKKFFERDLGVFLGYDEFVHFSIAPPAAHNLFKHLLKGVSLETAYSEMSKWYKTDYISPYWAELHKVENPDQPIDYSNSVFVTKTYTNNIDQEIANNQFCNNNYVEVEGLTTTTETDAISYGFLYGEKDKLNTHEPVTDVNIMELSSTIDKGNILFRGKLTGLEYGKTYNYRAYTSDGKYYNYGDVCSFTLDKPVDYPDLKVATQKLELEKGDIVSFTISAGSGEYSVGSSNAMVATASVNGNEVKIETFGAGSVTITVTDTKTHQTANVYVTVNEVVNPIVNPPHIEDLHIDAASIELIVGESKSITITSGNGDYTVKSSNESVATASINGTTVTVKAISTGSKVTITITDSKSGQTATVYVTVTEVITPIDDNPEDVIDLGLPSGMLWASCNLGATKPEEIGEYYAWGEISPNWYDASGQYSMDISHSGMGLRWDMTKYCTKEKYGTVDNKISLDLKDDVVHDVQKGRYRMPSWQDYEELITNCTAEWTALNGVNGCRFKGPNGKTIFFPATGVWMYGKLSALDTYGNYWSRSLYTKLPYKALTLCVFDETAVGGGAPISVSWEERYKCKPIRAVMLPEGSPSNLVDFALSGNVNPIIGLGEKCKLNVVSGNGSYTSSSKHPSIANVSVNNNVIEITGQNPGTTIIYITDKCSGQDIMVNVTVTPKTETPASAVDLGLPSGTKWASYNLGATRPEDYGDYYAWGEIEKKDSYSWSTYLHCDGEDYSCYELPNDISGTVYDIVKMKWGGSWRMPTVDDFYELSDNCQIEWISRSGTKGCLVTGPNGNSIFLPASGWVDGETKKNVNEYGLFWTPCLIDYNTDYGKSMGGFLDEGGIGGIIGDRYAGYSIRPVIK
jgi:hypothetical protein